MINRKMETLLNEQINLEMYSANAYWAMCSWLLEKDLDGFANYFKVQAKEELFHAEKQFDYLHDVGGKVTIKAIEQPSSAFGSVLEIFETALEHEKSVTKSIGNLIKAAFEENDFATHTFLQWFVTEQVEEEATVSQIVSKLKMIGDNSSALYLLNAELAQRKFNVATGGAE
ncbi:ferritin [Pedobacter nutrimenti]|uniref:Ferritin n=1 Tax=Pedobacter nutrimenti TaxID=1241337 RepID=A0A318UHV2_9SPHI|nr:ferritin [Pedobacter nutrimenti]PYF74927.1 ferritin [Pedobacter nutrimenti]